MAHLLLMPAAQLSVDRMTRSLLQAPKVMMIGHVKGAKPPGQPRKIWHDMVLSEL